ncbi:MAG: PAS domain S-box protein [Candidatus Latescibacteria bacterium]|jgi:PAS domain S-box-containing protein|nr:PAS domain S-box protein [Candidatus Latescibacterota bacterium]
MPRKKLTVQELEQRVKELEMAALERQQAEQALSLRVEFYEIMTERTGMMVYDYDIHSGIIKWSGAIAEITQYSSEEYQDFNIDKWVELIHEDDRELALSVLEGSMIDPSKYRVEYRLRRKDGSFVYVDDIGNFLKDEAGKVYRMLGCMRDISEHKQAEQALRESEDLYRITAQKTGQMLYDYDPATGKVKWEGAIEALTGLTYEEIQSRDVDGWTELIHEDDKKAVIDALDLARQQCSAFDVKYRFRQKDGHYLFIEEHGVFLPDAQGNAIRMLGSLQNITGRQQAEQALRESEGRYRRLAENARDMIYRMSLPSGKYEYVSPASSDIFGYTPDEFYDNPQLIVKVIHPDFLDYFVNQWNKLLTGDMPTYYEYKIIDKAGNERWLYQRNVLVCGDDGKQLALEGIVTEITDRKQVEEALLMERDKAQKYLDVAGVMLVVLDTNGRISLINNKGCEILGSSEKDIIGKSWFDNYLPKIYRKEVKGVFKQLMAGEVESVEYFENAIVNGSGEEKIIAWHNSILKDDNGGILGILSSGEDITERKKAEEALWESKERYKTLLENLPQKIFYKDINSVYISCNANLAEDLRIQPAEVAGKTDLDFFPQELAEKYRADDARIIKSGRMADFEEGYYLDGKEVVVYTAYSFAI